VQGEIGQPYFADFRGAKGLTQAQLESLIGNSATILPDGPSKTGKPLYIWSCWEDPPPDFDRLLLNAMTMTLTDPKLLRGEFLCGPDNPRRENRLWIGMEC